MTMLYQVAYTVATVMAIWEIVKWLAKPPKENEHE